MANTPNATDKPVNPAPAAVTAAAGVITNVDTTAAKTEASKVVPKGDPCVAVHRINGTIEPGTPFRPESAAQRDELVRLEAIRNLTEAEAVLFERMEAAEATVSADDTLG